MTPIDLWQLVVISLLEPSQTAASSVSSDGTSWTLNEMFPSAPFPYAPEAVTYGNGYFVAVAPPGTMYYSADGQNWIRKSTPYNLRGIANAYLIFVAVGDGGTLVTFSDPTDPTTWTSQDSGTTNNLSGVTFGDDTRFFVVGDGTILYSDPFGVDLTVTKPGSGTGTVRSLPPGINCGSDCNENYDAGTVVTLTAAPDTGSYFAGLVRWLRKRSLELQSNHGCSQKRNRHIYYILHHQLPPGQRLMAAQAMRVVPSFSRPRMVDILWEDIPLLSGQGPVFSGY